MFIVLPNPFCEWHLQNLVKRAGAVQPSIFLLKSLMYFLALCRKWRFLETFYWHDPDFVVAYPNNLIFTYFYLFAQYLRGWATPLFDFSSRHITDWQDLPKKRRHDRSVLWRLFLLPFQPRTLKTAWPSAWDTRRWPRKGEPENAAGRGQEIHAGRTANHCYHDSTFCQVEVNLASIDFNTHHNKSSGQNDHLIFQRYFWKLERFFPK